MRRLLLLLILLAIPQVGFAQLAPVTHNKQIEKIDIVLHRVTADSTVDPHAIRARMKTKVGESFSQLDFDQDLKTLADEFDRIEPTVDVRQNQVYITLNIWPKATIREIRFCGNKRIKSKKLRSELEIPKKSLFNRYEFNQSFQKLRDYYIRKGYFEAELSYRVVPDPITNEVDIEIQICEGRSGRVWEVCFDGFTSKEESDLCSMIQTKRYCFLVSFFTQQGTYHEEMVEQDRYVVLNYLHSEGYADAKVEIEAHERPDGCGLVLMIRCDKGEEYQFGEVTFAGNCLFSDEEIWNALGICPGSIYSPDALRCGVKRLSDLYGERGYIEAVVNYEPHLCPDSNCYDVHFDIEEGEQFRVGLVRVFGNSCTLQGVILHESLLEPGEIFDIRKLQKTEETLEHVGYFESVNVYAVRGSGDSCLGPNYRDVYIEVEETSTGNISFSAGYSTIDSIFGSLEIVERNFRIAGLTKIGQCGFGALRGGGEFLRARVSIGQKVDDYLLAWTKPFIFDSPWILGLDVDYNENRRITNQYELRSFNTGAHLTYPCNKFLAYAGHYRLRNLNVKLEIPELQMGETRLREMSDKEIRDLRDNDRERFDRLMRIDQFEGLPEELVAESKNEGLVSAVAASFVYDSVDSVCDAREGFRSVGTLEYAGLGGDFFFFNLGYVNTLYVPVYDCGILKFRYDARFIWPIGSTSYGTLPLNERIFIGGETTVRGYRSFSIGPQYGNGDPRGGISSMLWSAEFTHKFHRRFHGFVFFDAAYNSRGKWSFATPRCSVGLGIRFEIMNQVPIMLGYGWPLNPNPKYDQLDGSNNQVQRFFFAVGGRF